MSKSIVLVFLILCVLFVVVGCHAVTDSINDYQMCNGDVNCRAKMIEYGNVTVSAVKASGLSSSLFESIAFNIACWLS